MHGPSMGSSNYLPIWQSGRTLLRSKLLCMLCFWMCSVSINFSNSSPTWQTRRFVPVTTDNHFRLCICNAYWISDLPHLSLVRWLLTDECFVTEFPSSYCFYSRWGGAGGRRINLSPCILELLLVSEELPPETFFRKFAHVWSRSNGIKIAKLCDNIYFCFRNFILSREQKQEETKKKKTVARSCSILS